VGLLTTTVGWLPKPTSLLRARWRFSEGEIEAEELRRVEDAAMRAALELQQRIGLDVLVDGQLDRGDMVGHFAARLEGMELLGLVRCFGNRYYRRPRIVGEVRRAEPITVERWKAASALASRPVKAIVTGPYTLMDWSFDEHYRSREACCRALAEVIRAEVEDLLEAGATELQIDEPAISTRPEEMDLAASALERVTGAARGRARCWTHVAYGDLAPVLDRVLALPVDGVLLELANSDDSWLDALAGLPPDKLLGAGVIDVLDPEVESVGVVRNRIRAVLARLPADRVRIAPDSGMRTLPPAVASAKLEAMVAAAAEF